MFQPSTAKRYEGTGRWLIKIVAGLFIVFFLGLHFIVNHLVAPDGLLSYADVVAYYQNPFVLIMEISFLVVVVTHSFLGLRSIFLDLNPSPKVLSIINVFLLITGIAAIIYGTWLAITVASRG